MTIKDIYSALIEHQLCVPCPSPVDGLCSAVRRAVEAGVEGLSVPALQALDLAAEAVVTYAWHGLMDQASALRETLAPLLNAEGDDA